MSQDTEVESRFSIKRWKVTITNYSISNLTIVYMNSKAK